MRIVTAVIAIALLMGVNLWAQTTMPVTQPAAQPVKFGIDVLRDEGFKSIEGKRIGIVANPASLDGNLKHVVDDLYHAKNVKLVELFGPEHGIWGAEYAGAKIENKTEPHTGLPVFSLYGKTRSPTTRMILPLEALVLDLQDIGSRSYTYISTMKACMETCAKFNIELVILDRPNPLGGERVEGPMLYPGFESFVGAIPVPYVHGMTMGELAILTRDLYLPDFQKLKVIKMQGWKRSMIWSDTGHPWIPTSPHVPRADSSAAYAATGILGELYTISIGVGYTLPFESIAAPWLDAEAVANGMPPMKGVLFRPVYYTPFYSSFKGEQCQGVQVHLDPRTAENLVEINYRAIALLGAKTLFDQAEIVAQREEDELAKKEKRKAVKQNRYKMFDKVSGSDEPRKWLLEGKPLEPLFEKWKKDCDAFKRARAKYLLY